LVEVKVETSPRTEDRILANALKHFCDFGYNGTSVREITAASEVTKPTLYYYFKNKEELFAKLAETCFEMVLKSMDEVVAKNESLEKSVKALFDCLNEVFTHNPAAIKFIHSIAVAPQRGAPDVGVKKFVEQIDKNIRQVVTSGVGRGECLETKAETLILLLTSLLGLYTKNFMTSGIYDLGDKTRVDQAIATLVTCAGNSACVGAI
jgi:AcrR family transcriptional regulator